MASRVENNLNLQRLYLLVDYLENLECYELQADCTDNVTSQENLQIVSTPRNLEDWNKIGKTLRSFADELKRKLESGLYGQAQSGVSYRVGAEGVTSLSNELILRFPELSRYFNTWKPCREKLIKTLKATADKLDRNFTCVSYIRILASSIDFAGNVARILQGKEFTLGGIATGNLSFVSLASLLLEKMWSVGMYTTLKRQLHKDQELFKEIKRWFEQAKEIDSAVMKMFPYGIDQGMILKINKSAQVSEDCSKLFMSVVASNTVKEIKLSEDSEFLSKAALFATSNTGKLWFQKVLLENDPIFNESLSMAQDAAIDQAASICHGLEKTYEMDVCSETLQVLLKKKALFNLLNICSAVNGLWNELNLDETNPLREFANKREEELRAIKSMLQAFENSSSENR